MGAPRPRFTGERGAWLRLAGLAAGIAVAFALVLGFGDLSSSAVRDRVRDAGVWAPLAFVALSAALTVAFFPGPLLAGAAGLLFGTAAGFPLSLAAAVLGACAAFGIARAIGGDAVIRAGGERVNAIRAAIGRRGFLSVLYARIIPGLPYSLVNYAAGLTAIPVRTFAAATALGAAPRAFAYTALGGSLDDLTAPAAVIAIAVLVALALGGLVVLKLSARATPGGAGTGE